MKKLFLLPMAVLAIMLGSCNSQLDEDFQNLSGQNIINAEMPNVTSRTTTSGLKVLWAEGDQIGVIRTASETQPNSYVDNPFTLSTGKGTQSATFKAASSQGIANVLAYYPYRSGTTYNGKLTMDIPAEQDYEAGNQMVMVGMFESGSNSVAFKNAMSLAVITVKNIPVGYTKAVLAASGNEYLAGTATMTWGDSNPNLLISNNQASNTLTINFGDNTDTEKRFYFAIPAGTYANGLTMTLEGEGYEPLRVGVLKDDTENNLYTPEVNEFVDHTITLNDEVSAVQMIGSAQELKSALEAGEGGNFKLSQSITLDGSLNVSDDTTIDLNGQNLNAGSNTITVGEGKSLTLTNNSASGVARSATTSGISGSGDIIIASKGSTITIGEGVDLITTGAKSCCVWIPSGAENVTLNTAGNLKATSAGAAVIYHNGLLDSGTINITGGSVEHETDVAVYIAGKANVTVSGNARITGTTAMEVRAGKLTVNGGKFEATASPSDYTPNGNGTTSVGVALAMVKHSTTENDLEVVINDGEFAGVKSLLVNKDLGEVSVTVNGGTFSEPTALNYLGNNANVKVVLNDNYIGQGFETFSGQTVVLDLNNKIYNATDPLVGSNNTKSQAFHFEKGSKITIKNGTLTSAQARMFMQNYTDLTLENVTLNPTIPEETTSKYYYVLSNNSGNVNLVGKTSIIAPIKEGIESFAFDVCQYASYPAPEVNVETTGTIQGLVEVSGGTLNVKAGTFKNEKGHCVKVVTGTANFSGGTFVAQEVTVFNMAGTVNITDGVFTSNDNAVISGNGTNDAKYQNGTIDISGGTFNAKIKSEGYVACGIYHPQRGTLKVTGGTFNVEKGCGILMRGGSLDMTNSNASFNFTGNNNNNTGKVGDSRVVVPCGWQIVRDDYSAYYDAENITINGVSDEYIYKIENQQ